MTLFSELPEADRTGAGPDEMDQELGTADPETSGLEQADLELETFAQETEGIALEPELRYDVPGCESAWVTGNPYGLANRIDYLQGDNSFRASGNCGLLSVRNMLARAGFEISEDEITKFAIENGLCVYDVFGEAAGNGGTTVLNRWKILNALGVQNDMVAPGSGGTLEDIADAVDSGRGVLISVNAGILWNYDDGAPIVNGRPQINHCVSVTGIARDTETGAIRGVYIADSGRGEPGDACRFLTTEEFHQVYTNAYGSAANITREPIMGG